MEEIALVGRHLPVGLVRRLVRGSMGGVMAAKRGDAPRRAGAGTPRPLTVAQPWQHPKTEPLPLHSIKRRMSSKKAHTNSASSTQCATIAPRLSISMRTVSPARKNFGGEKAAPTPAQVPVKTTSPGSSVITCVS